MSWGYYQFLVAPPRFELGTPASSGQRSTDELPRPRELYEALRPTGACLELAERSYLDIEKSLPQSTVF